MKTQIMLKHTLTSLILLLISISAQASASPNASPSPSAAPSASPGNTIAKLETQILALQAEIKTLQAQGAAEIAALQAQITAIQHNKALELGPFVSVDPNPVNNVRGPNIFFRNANVHIESGSGATDDHGNSTGLGNFIVGYNEIDVSAMDHAPDRTGPHNIIIGQFQNWFHAAFGNVLVGSSNEVSGSENLLAGDANSVTGRNNVCFGLFNQILSRNGAVPIWNSILGGLDNEIVSTGTDSGNQDVVVGGFSNAILNSESVILGLSGIALFTGSNMLLPEPTTPPGWTVPKN